MSVSRPAPDKAVAVEIQVQVAEGPKYARGFPTHLGEWVSHSSWEDADEHIFRARPEMCHYNKVDFKVVFDDGSCYSGTYDVPRNERKIIGLQRRIQRALRMDAGKANPRHMSREEWAEYLGDKKYEAQGFLLTHDLFAPVEPARA